MPSDIIGHEHIIRFFNQSLARGTLAHVYLLTGPLSVGKTSLMRMFAGKILCEKGKGDDGCVSCTAYVKNQHSDFFLLDPDENEERKDIIPIDTVREIERLAQLKPALGAIKVFAVAHADRLNNEAANALLKVLEDPPAQTIFFLSAEFPHHLPLTLRSRTHRLYCPPVSIETVAALLEKQGVEKKQSLRLALLSYGAPGLALHWAKSNTNEEQYMVHVRTWIDLLERPQGIFAWAARMESVTDELRTFLHIGHLLVHDLLRMHYGRTTRLLVPFADGRESALIKKYSREKISHMSAAIIRAIGLLQTNVSSKLLFENLFLSF